MSSVQKYTSFDFQIDRGSPSIVLISPGGAQEKTVGDTWLTHNKNGWPDQSKSEGGFPLPLRWVCLIGRTHEQVWRALKERTITLLNEGVSSKPPKQRLLSVSYENASHDESSSRVRTRSDPPPRKVVREESANKYSRLYLADTCFPQILYNTYRPDRKRDPTAGRILDFVRDNEGIDEEKRKLLTLAYEIYSILLNMENYLYAVNIKREIGNNIPSYMGNYTKLVKEFTALSSLDDIQLEEYKSFEIRVWEASTQLDGRLNKIWLSTYPEREIRKFKSFEFSATPEGKPQVIVTSVDRGGKEVISSEEWMKWNAKGGFDEAKVPLSLRWISLITRVTKIWSNLRDRLQEDLKKDMPKIIEKRRSRSFSHTSEALKAIPGSRIGLTLSSSPQRTKQKRGGSRIGRPRSADENQAERRELLHYLEEASIPQVIASMRIGNQNVSLSSSFIYSHIMNKLELDPNEKRLIELSHRIHLHILALESAQTKPSLQEISELSPVFKRDMDLFSKAVEMDDRDYALFRRIAKEFFHLYRDISKNVQRVRVGV